MNLSSFRMGLWIAVAVVVIVAVLWIDYRGNAPGNGEGPALQADFELTDHAGALRRDEDFRGKWLLVFFGFANCPDVCPTTLAEVAAVMAALGIQADQVQPLFITIDPERDTPDALAEFVAAFDADIVGLTGTSAQIAGTAKAFYVYYEKADDASAPDGYTMGHSSQLFLFDPAGGFVKTFSNGTPAEEILADLKSRL